MSIEDRYRRRIDIGNIDGQFVFDLYDENGNKVIHIDDDGNGIFSGTIRGGKIESDTDINVTKDATIGRRIILQDRNKETQGFEEVGIISVDTGVMLVSSRNSRAINIKTDGNINLYGNKCRVNDLDIATKKDTIELINTIQALETRISSLEKEKK